MKQFLRKAVFFLGVLLGLALMTSIFAAALACGIRSAIICSEWTVLACSAVCFLGGILCLLFLFRAIQRLSAPAVPEPVHRRNASGPFPGTPTEPK